MKDMGKACLWAAYVMQPKDVIALCSMEREQRGAYMENMEESFINTIISMMELYYYGTYFVNFMYHLLDENYKVTASQSYFVWQTDEINRMYTRLSDTSIEYFLNYINQTVNCNVCCCEEEIILSLFNDWLNIIQTARDNKCCILISYE